MYTMGSGGSGNRWTANELLAFNIEVKQATTTSFFNTADLPAPPASETILNNLEEPNGPLSKPDRKFFQYLKMAVSDESAAHDFVGFLLKLLVYDHDERLLRTNKEISFYLAGQLVKFKADLALMDDTLHLLIVQEKKLSSGDDAEAQLIAKAIAAFRMNNLHRFESDLPQLERDVIPGIIMVGSAPIFYRITVTTALINALLTSTYPAGSTIVLKYIPPVPNPVDYSLQGMRPLENRRVVFQCFEAFKAAILSHLHPGGGENLTPQII